MFRKANTKDINQIFHFWNKVTKSTFRIFGLSDSISEGGVYVMENSKSEICGYVRFELNFNKTNDYVKINEIAIVSDKFITEEFILFVKTMIFMLGYTKAKASVTIDDCEKYIKYGWVIEGIKNKISKNKTFNSISIKCDLCEEEYPDISFGEFL